MKTKELIEALMKADPTGELEVAVGNQMISWVRAEPAWYDGCIQHIWTDNAGIPRSASIRSDGYKVCIGTTSVREAIYIHPSLPVVYEGQYAKATYQILVEGWRTSVLFTNDETKQRA